MGRPGAGSSGSVGRSTGAVHKVSTGSSGSMHRVGTNSVRPAATSSIVNKPKPSTQSIVNKPKTNTESPRPIGASAIDKHRTTTNAGVQSNRVSNNSTHRPNMNSSYNMLGEAKKQSNYEDTERRKRVEQHTYEGTSRREAPIQPKRESSSVQKRETVKQEQSRVIDTKKMSPDEIILAGLALRALQESNRTSAASNTRVVNTSHVDDDSVYGSSMRVQHTHETSAENDNLYGADIPHSSKSTSIKSESETKKSMSKNYYKPYLYYIVGCIITVVIFAVIISSGSKKQETALDRIKLDTGYSYMNNCVNDELGWLNKQKVSKGIQQFYKDTGAQPYIWLRAYDGADLTDSEAYNVATAYYDINFADRQDVVLYAYFEESDPNVIGSMALIHGTASGTIMDAEAEDIFWNYLDDAWSTYGEDQTDEMFIHIFNSTGKTIMYHPTSFIDVLHVLMILLSIVALGCAVVVAIKEINKRSKEKAAETERILSSSLNDLSKEKEDDLLNKYK